MSASMIEVKHGDCLEVMKALPAGSIDSVVTDPPYGLQFMGKRWDREVPSVEVWREVFRVLKPGGHLLSFFGTRTYHRGAVNIEDAGFEIRDQLGWMYGSGFPKSMDISKAIDKASGATRRVVGTRVYGDGHIQRSSSDKLAPPIGTFERSQDRRDLTEPATAEAKQWQGWGTALKPAWEPIVLARKPHKGTVAGNVLKHGTGGLNVDACRVGTTDKRAYKNGPGGKSHHYSSDKRSEEVRPDAWTMPEAGRYPANVLHDGSPDVLEVMGPAARFFYCAKVSVKERGNTKHPTMKPLALMRYLVRLVTPLEGTILDPFAGSGTTLLAAKLEGFQAIGIEKEAEYVQIIKERLQGFIASSIT